MNEPTHIKLDIDLDGWTQSLQANLVQADADGLGWGYRLAGPKYNGSSRNLLSRTLDKRDAQEIRDALNAVFPDERITQLTDERDRARRIAVALEQEVAELTRARAAARAATLREVANDWEAHCPDHSTAEEVQMDCLCEQVDELRRRANTAEQAAR